MWPVSPGNLFLPTRAAAGWANQINSIYPDSGPFGRDGYLGVPIWMLEMTFLSVCLRRRRSGIGVA